MHALIILLAISLLALLQCIAQPSSNSWSSLHSGFLSLGTNLPSGADALLIISPGTDSIAPLKFSSGPLLTNITPGTMEYLDHTFYLTTYLVRRSVQLNQDIVVNPTTVTNTVAETTIYTIEMAPNYPTVGKVIVPKLYGIYWSSNPQTFTLRLKKGASTLLSTTSTVSPSTAKPWEAQFVATVLTIGNSGTLQASARLIQDQTLNMDALTAATSIDTTVTNTFTVTCQWSSTGANSLQLNQGFTECIQ